MSEAAPKPTEVRKRKTKKNPVADPGTHDGHDTNRLVNCWCSGGANGSGPTQCQAGSCDGADSCCVDAYGAGAESSDPEVVCLSLAF